ncbi:MAG: HTH-type transcriptional regulator HdfR [Candidatus Celerinatantimonas neptuna]|nr:MAG: HTH-type transcriptional regulator HdfR [Candidatus Celerinatantimonas neptuna]
MNSKINDVNWQSWYYFTSTAECGSLSQAAGALGISQSTLSRQLVTLEKTLGHSLFNRSTQGVTLTEFGSQLLEEAQLMQQSAHRLQRLASGERHKLNGRLRVSVNEVIAQYYLPHILPDFFNRYPDIYVEIEVNNHASNIDKRDTDIAVRMFQPTQTDLVARHLFDISLGLYASQRYLASVTLPKTPEDLFKLRVLGYDRDPQIEQGSQALGWDLHNEDFRFRCDCMPMHIELARNGGGIVITHADLAKQFQLQHIEIGFKLPKLPVFLVCHRDVQHNQKIRVMMDFLAQRLAGALS